VDGYYHNLLNPKDDAGDSKEPNGSLTNDKTVPKKPEKWKAQIEKVTRHMDHEPQSLLLWL